MPLKCCIVNCRSNYVGEKESVPVFSFPDKEKEEDLRKRWIKFINRKNWEPSDSSVICKNHFEPIYVKQGKDGKRYRLIKSLKPVPTIFDPASKEGPTASHMKAPISVPRKSPKKRPFQEEQYDKFLAQDTIKKLQ